MKCYGSHCFCLFVIAFVEINCDDSQDENVIRRNSLLVNFLDMMLSTINTKFAKLDNVDTTLNAVINRIVNMDNRIREMHLRLDFIAEQLHGNACTNNDANRDEKKDARSRPRNKQGNSKQGSLQPSHRTTPMAQMEIYRIARSYTEKPIQANGIQEHPPDDVIEHDLQISRNLANLKKLIEQFDTTLKLTNQSTAACNEAFDSNLDTQAFDKMSSTTNQIWTMIIGLKTAVTALARKSEEAVQNTEKQAKEMHEQLHNVHTKIDRLLHNWEYKRVMTDDLKTDEQSVVTNVIGGTSTSRHAHRNLYYTKRHHNMYNEDDSDVKQTAESEMYNTVIRKTKSESFQRNASFTPLDQKTKDYSCADIINHGNTESGIYYIQIKGTTYWYLRVYCEMSLGGGGWIIIQRRGDFGVPRENFNRDWKAYRQGFGDLNKEFWLGNENIYMLTNTEDYVLRIELEDFEKNVSWAQYSSFKLCGEEEDYKLEVSGYEGNAGDSLNDPWYGSHLRPFSTYNRDNDMSSLNCASMLKGGWWWRSCGRGLNGLYFNNSQDANARQGIVWFKWRGWEYTLKRSLMMIRPKSFNEDQRMLNKLAPKS